MVSQYNAGIAVLPNESVLAFTRRYGKHTGHPPSGATMHSCWHPRPIVECDITLWADMHAWLGANVLPEDYMWYGNIFFFTHEHHAAIFRLMFG